LAPLAWRTRIWLKRAAGLVVSERHRYGSHRNPIVCPIEGMHFHRRATRGKNGNVS
jgi:hypothetical protein